MGAGNHKFTLPSSLLAQLCLFMLFGLFDSLLFLCVGKRQVSSPGPGLSPCGGGTPDDALQGCFFFSPVC